MQKSSLLIRRVTSSQHSLRGLALASLLFPAHAHAQPRHPERDQHVVFDDDLLHADITAPLGARVFPSHLPPARTQLIRPRTNFLAELYKSVEHI